MLLNSPIWKKKYMYICIGIRLRNRRFNKFKKCLSNVSFWFLIFSDNHWAQNKQMWYHLYKCSSCAWRVYDPQEQGTHTVVWWSIQLISAIIPEVWTDVITELQDYIQVSCVVNCFVVIYICLVLQRYIRTCSNYCKAKIHYCDENYQYCEQSLKV
jgi:hypothetical protein